MLYFLYYIYFIFYILHIYLICFVVYIDWNVNVLKTLLGLKTPGGGGSCSNGPWKVCAHSLTPRKCSLWHTIWQMWNSFFGFDELFLSSCRWRRGVLLEVVGRGGGDYCHIRKFYLMPGDKDAPQRPCCLLKVSAEVIFGQGAGKEAGLGGKVEDEHSTPKPVSGPVPP